MAYFPAVKVPCVRFRLGLAVFSDEVLDSVQTSRSVLVPVPFASSAALEDMKNSEPPLAGEASPCGDVLGQTVKPGLPLSSPTVSIWFTATLPPAASADLEKA
jgi:hypothetical protein